MVQNLTELVTREVVRGPKLNFRLSNCYQNKTAKYLKLLIMKKKSNEN